MDRTIDDAVAVEMERVQSRYGAATRAILHDLTLRGVLDEVAAAVGHIQLTQDDLEQIRSGFGLPPREAPLPDNVVKFKPRARGAAPNHGGNAA